MNTSSSSILVTGGAGYVGSHTVLELIKHNYTVVVVDNLVNAFQDDGALLPESLNRVQQLTGKTILFYNVNILDKEALEIVFKKHKFSCVIHFAALKAVGESVQLPLTYYRNNLTGSCNLFELMSKYDVKSLVFSSSATVYGNPNFLPITENHPIGNCTNPYGKSKYFIEEMLMDLCISDKDWHVISLRYFNPVGAHSSGKIGEDPKGIPNNLMPFIAQVAVGRREYLTVYGNDYNTKDGTGVRDYIHIEDLATGHLSALEHLEDKPGFRAYNLGTGRGVSVLEMVAAFRETSGASIPTKIEARRLGDIAACYADTQLAEAELGWKAKRNLIDMCRDTWNWQTKNPNGFADK